ncbi:MAG: hypothetical protein Q4F71_10330 [Paracoccus sp. (in: a-proteobacteria)]|nr:hypothetical protein [Paracoccus sp. (in: a-proteobacteria)]
MRKTLSVAAAALGISLAAASLGEPNDGTTPPSDGASAGLLQGCGDVPEAVALLGALRGREAGITRYLQAIDRREEDLRSAEARLRERLEELRGLRDVQRRARIDAETAVQADIAQLVAVYDGMRPRDAAAIMGDLPPEFAAEILMRLNPAASARIIASVEPRQAAILTTYMGARRAHQR